MFDPTTMHMPSQCQTIKPI